MGLLTACGSGAATPTALPPDVVRPEQPAPEFAHPADEFRLTPAPTAPSAAQESVAGRPVDAALAPRPVIRLPIEQHPTALGLASRAVTLHAAPDGPVIRTVPAGDTITITGRNADGQWLAAYVGDGTAGWVTPDGLVLYGASDLEEVTRALEPREVATLLAESMAPVDLPAAALTAAPTPRPLAVAATVADGQGVAIRAQPDDSAAEVGSVPVDATLTVMGRSADGLWLVVMTDGGFGWVQREGITLGQDPDTLPIISP